MERRDDARRDIVEYREDEGVWVLHPEVIRDGEEAGDIVSEIEAAVLPRWDAACLGCGSFLIKGVRKVEAEKKAAEHMEEHGGPANISHVRNRSKVQETIDGFPESELEDHSDHEPTEEEMAKEYSREDPRVDPREAERYKQERTGGLDETDLLAQKGDG